MNLPDAPRQSDLGVLRFNFRNLIMGAAVTAFCAAVLLYISSPDTNDTTAPAKTLVPAATEQKPLAVTASGTLVPSAPDTGFSPVVPQSPAIIAQQTPSLSELESQFRSTYDKEDKRDTLKAIAGWNNAEAVAVLSRLFKGEKHPASREAVIVALGDIDARENVPVRLDLLAAASQRQPRDIRTTALDLLESTEDPRATQLIAQMMRTDPDKEVREAAKAIYKARANPNR
jgi:hypothetical protein